MKTCLLTGARRIIALCRTTLKNLWAGVKLFLFLKVSARDFALSAGNLWSIAVILVVTCIVGDYFYIEKPDNFYGYNLECMALYFAAVLFAGALASCIARKRSLSFSFPVVFLNALWLPLILDYAVLIHFRAALKNENADYHTYRQFTYLILFWVAFRAMIILAPKEALRQLAATLAAVGLFWFLNDHFYPTYFWYQNYDESHDNASLMAEDALSDQFMLLDEQLAKITPRTKGKNYYVVTYGSDDAQDVFMKEALYARDVLGHKFGAVGHVITLINNPAMLAEMPYGSVHGLGRMFKYIVEKNTKPVTPPAEKPRFPLATVANLNRTLVALGKKADPKNDVLILYVTSHGGRNSTISVELADLQLQQLTAGKLKSMLDQSGFKWKVLLISACFSGSFVDKIKDDNTIILTSSREDRVSYGCGMDNDLTYFGMALLRDALPKTDSFIRAYELARESIEHHEEDDRIATHSQPQLYVGRNAKDYLK